MSIKKIHRDETGAAQLASFLNTRPELHFSFVDTSALKEGIAQLHGRDPSQVRAEVLRARQAASITELPRQK
jgi:hypothetical protein